ncbi:MAG TPA: beta-galactosidase trimerization domain-containing protein, partial [Solirubrobacterales bacterium]
GGVQGPKLVGATRLHDGIAIYYSHPSIQVSWMLDAEPHGRTWPNRNDDHRLGTSHNVRLAWETMLEDAGLGYDFLAYDEVVLHGVPARYKALILPAAYALSDVEARRIADFAANGGTVIADFACGLFDQHGRGRSKGALDDLFGVRHDGTETRNDFFGGKLWVETDQEKGYKSKSHRELLDTLSPRLHQGFAIAERKLPVGTVRRVGRGKAVYLNLSPQRYLLYRDARRRTFLDPLGVKPWIRVAGPGLETVAWSKNGRTLVLILQNSPPVTEARVPVRVQVAAPVTGVVDERTGRPLPDGDRFQLDLDTAEAVFLSFQSPPGAVLKFPGP